MEKQMVDDLIEIFDEEYEKRRLITPQNTAKKLIAKGYRKQSETAKEIFEEFESRLLNYIADYHGCYHETFDELKKKYLKGADDGKAD